jgi:hypothetical protein
MAPPMVFPPRLEGIGGLDVEEDGGHGGYCRFKDDGGDTSLLSSHHHPTMVATREQASLNSTYLDNPQHQQEDVHQCHSARRWQRSR